MQLIKYQCRGCRYVFVQLHADGEAQTAACPRCHHRDLIRQADFAAMPPPCPPPVGDGAGSARALGSKKSCPPRFWQD